MTSRYPREIGVRANGDVLPREFATLAERMAASGYRTAAFVSTYLLKPHAAGLHRGFDHYDAAMTRANLGHERFERRADETVDRAIRFLEETAGRRVFLWVHLYDPHGKYDPGPELTRRFYRSTGRPKLDATKIVGYQRFGDALVAVAADHGEGLGEDDYWFRHGSLLNRAALHVPLVFAGPGIGAVHTERAVTQNLDIAPTLLDLAGLDPLPDARGRSLSGRDRSPVASFAEARRRGGVGDRTGIDTRYKVSITTETGHTVHRPGAEDCPSEALRDWLFETGDRTADGSVDPDVEDALRGLGYSR
jgi:arylsulfatase A-like enzyme